MMLVTIKVGGDLLVKGFPSSLASEVKAMMAEHKFIIVHGGGDIVSEISERLGHPPRFVTSPRGFRSRYTDRETADIYAMVMRGKINMEAVSTLQRAGVQAFGLSGLDGGAVRAVRKEQIIALDERGRRVLIDGGYTGQIGSVNAPLLSLLLGAGYTPVISAVAMGAEAEPLNVDGDRMAAGVAAATAADRLVLLTDVDGLQMDGARVTSLKLAEAEALQGKIGPGMSTKVFAATEALAGGVGEVVISSGLKSDAIAAALTHNGGTVITK